MSLKTYICLALGMLIGCCHLLGQSESISGTVTDSQGKALVGASVYIDGTSVGTTTDDLGHWRLSEMVPGTYRLEVSYIGYLTQSASVVLSIGGHEKFDFELPMDALQMETVVVSATRYEKDRVNNPVIVNVLDDKLFNASQSVVLSESLNYQPGVRVETNCLNCGFTQIRLNGLQGAYSQILINSRPIFSALNGVYGLDQIPASMVQQVEVVRSGGSALFGSNAIGGTINIITQEPVESYWEIGSRTSLISGQAWDHTVDGNAALVGKSGKTGATFYGMHRQRDSYDANDDGFTELVKLENTVLGTKAYYRPNDRSKVSLDFSALKEYRRGGDRLDIKPHLADITEELEHETYFGGIEYEIWNHSQNSKLVAYTSGQITNRESYYGGLGGGRTNADSTLALKSYGQTQDYSMVGGLQGHHYFSSGDVLTLGAELQYFDTEDEISGYDRVTDQRVLTGGLYGQYEWNPSEKWTALIGLRHDRSRVRGDYRLGELNSEVNLNLDVWSPRLTLMHHISETLRLRGGYARGFRAPQAFDEELHVSLVGGEPLFVLPSDNLTKESSDAFTASINYSESKGTTQLNLLLEGFYTFLHDPFVQVSTGATLPNGSIVQEVRNGEGAEVSGINFEAGYTTSAKWAIQLGGTLQTSRYDQDQLLFIDESLPEEAPERQVVIDRFVRTPDVYGYITSRWDISSDLAIDLTSNYTGSMIVPRVVSESGFMDLVKTEQFMDINLNLSYLWQFKKGLSCEISAGMKNILNSYQDDFDSGPMRDSEYIYGPMAPRSVFLSVVLSNLRR